MGERRTANGAETIGKLQRHQTVLTLEGRMSIDVFVLTLPSKASMEIRIFFLKDFVYVCFTY